MFTPLSHNRSLTLVKSSAIVWATTKAVVLTYAAWIAVALGFAGLSELGARVFERSSMEQFTTLRAASRFWTEWWFYIFGILSAPLWIGLFAFFTRRLVGPGFRLAAAGYLLIFMGALGGIASLAHYLGAPDAATDSEALLNSGMAAVTMFIGLVVCGRRGKVA